MMYAMRSPSGGEDTGREVGVEVIGGTVGVRLTGMGLGAEVDVIVSIGIGVVSVESVPHATNRKMNTHQKYRRRENFVFMVNLLSPKYIGAVTTCKKMTNTYVIVNYISSC